VHQVPEKIIALGQAKAKFFDRPEKNGNAFS
jgi:hypothetical protein